MLHKRNWVQKQTVHSHLHEILGQNYTEPTYSYRNHISVGEENLDWQGTRGNFIDSLKQNKQYI